MNWPRRRKLYDGEPAIGKEVKKSPHDNVSGKKMSLSLADVARHGNRRREGEERKLITKYNSMATFYSSLCQVLMICGECSTML